MITIVVIDTLCAILFVAGVEVVLRGARAKGGGEQGSPSASTYVTRIVGTMMAFFALALSTLMTLFFLMSH